MLDHGQLTFSTIVTSNVFQKTPLSVAHGLQNLIQSFFYSLSGPSFDLNQHFFLGILLYSESNTSLFSRRPRMVSIPICLGSVR